MDHTRLRRISARQLGLFTRAQAKECGFSLKQIRTRVAHGEWVQVVGPVFAAPTIVVTMLVRDRATHLAVRDSILAGPSAARHWRLPVPDGPSCLAVPPEAHVALRGVRFLRCVVEPIDLVSGAGSLRVTSRERAVFDCLSLLPEAAARTLLDRALQQGWTTLEDIARRVSDQTGRWGVPRALRLLREAGWGTRSEAERMLAGLLRRAGIGGWRANVAVLPGVVGDVVFARERVIVEVDGWAYHSRPEEFQRDRARQNRLVLAGWTVLRFTWRDLTTEPERVVRTIRAALAQLVR